MTDRALDSRLAHTIRHARHASRCLRTSRPSRQCDRLHKSLGSLSSYHPGCISCSCAAQARC